MLEYSRFHHIKEGSVSLDVPILGPNVKGSNFRESSVQLDYHCSSIQGFAESLKTQDCWKYIVVSWNNRPGPQQYGSIITI